MNHSPQEGGDANLAKVQQHLAKLRTDGLQLPMNGQRVNIEQLAKDCGLRNRTPFYTNRKIKSALVEFTGSGQSIESAQSRREFDEVRSKLMKAEQQIAALRAENDALKAESRELLTEQERQRAMQEIILLGRRVIE